MNVQLENISNKKTAIFEATLELVKRHGFHGTPMSKIAKNAEVAAGTIYHYFESKEMLIHELFLFVQDKLAATLEVLDESLPYKELFIQYWVGQCDFFIKNPNILFFLEQYKTSPYSNCTPKNESKLFLNKVVSLFERGINSKHIREIDYQLLIPVVHGSIFATAKYHLMGHYAFTEEKLRETALLIWDGIKMQ